MSDSNSPKIAIIGSGPSGCYSAQALLKTVPNAEITVFDRLPVPFGLARFGVAADHQGTKGVTKQFARLFERQGVKFVGNLNVGEHVELDTIREHFDAVIVATGLHEDRQLDIPGSATPGVVGAGYITRALNSHPEAKLPLDYSLGEVCIVVGAGNVAIDCMRLLTKNGTEFTGSDVHDDNHQQLSGKLRELHLVSRSGVDQAKFDDSMLREMTHFEHVRHELHFGSGDLAAVTNENRRDILTILQDKCTDADPELRGVIHWWFGFAPHEVHGGNLVDTLEIVGEDGTHALIKTDSVITAIGFQGDPLVPVTEAGRETGKIEQGLYVGGWARRGPRGTIASQRIDALELAKIIGADLADLNSTKSGVAGLNLTPGSTIDYDGWKRIEQKEIEAARSGRARHKFDSIEEMLKEAGMQPTSQH
ncbi:FAD-dependent oxidoreductase [Canibacter zhoujuaniae]|uniref:FAD-dependent oxidoreductase n=1 Tax=Canibacter zhoujuaniae TaxID=2708343 RepID=UPI001423EFE5|nr:FAD-dependent oxidoreductase [Canibacter zhoujuaniae]